MRGKGKIFGCSFMLKATPPRCRKLTTKTGFASHIIYISGLSPLYTTKFSLRISLAKGVLTM
jgi:hypothetical protein